MGNLLSCFDNRTKRKKQSNEKDEKVGKLIKVDIPKNDDIPKNNDNTKKVNKMPKIVKTKLTIENNKKFEKISQNSPRIFKEKVIFQQLEKVIITEDERMHNISLDFSIMSPLSENTLQKLKNDTSIGGEDDDNDEWPILSQWIAPPFLMFNDDEIPQKLKKVTLQDY